MTPALTQTAEMMQHPHTDDTEMDIVTQNGMNRLVDRLDRQMTTSKLEQDPDAMDIDIAPSQQAQLTDSQISVWGGYQPRYGEQQDCSMYRDYGRTMCGACMEMIKTDNLITIDCGCHYCTACFNGYFETGLSSRGSFPPRCCGQEIYLRSVRQYLENRIVERYEEVQEEYGSKNPTYCASCGTFLPGAVISADFKACGKCPQQTCIRCKNPRALHDASIAIRGTDLLSTGRPRSRQCPGVDVPSEIKVLIKKEEWNRCPSCQHVVEKTEGCNFMECICGTEFCYGCGVEYGTDDEYCDCPDNPHEDDEDDADNTEEEADDGESGEWPQYSAAINARGRIRCMHELTGPVNEDGEGADDGGRCHGCLREMPDIRSCDNCRLELCTECLR